MEPDKMENFVDPEFDMFCEIKLFHDGQEKRKEWKA
jgi:alpha-D-ribose 1-methylphosphonate 5-phosphate C-P lyase